MPDQSPPGVSGSEVPSEGVGVLGCACGEGHYYESEVQELRDLLNVCLDHLIVHDETCHLLDEIPRALRKIGVRR